MTVFLIRHSSALGQEPEATLSDAGEREAIELARVLAGRGVRRIISSPFRRAIDTIRPLADQLGVSIEIDARLAERQLGHVEDGDWMSALRQSFDDFTLCLPHGESSAVAQARGRAVIDEALSSEVVPAAIVSHGNLLSLVAKSFDQTLGFNFWESLTNPDVFELTQHADEWGLRRLWEKV